MAPVLAAAFKQFKEHKCCISFERARQESLQMDYSHHMHFVGMQVLSVNNISLEDMSSSEDTVPGSFFKYQNDSGSFYKCLQFHG